MYLRLSILHTCSSIYRVLFKCMQQVTAYSNVPQCILYAWMHSNFILKFNLSLKNQLILNMVLIILGLTTICIHLSNNYKYIQNIHVLSLRIQPMYIKLQQLQLLGFTDISMQIFASRYNRVIITFIQNTFDNFTARCDSQSF